jgi:hypothetical protein
MTRELSLTRSSNPRLKAGTIPVEQLLRSTHSSAQAVLAKIATLDILSSKASSTYTLRMQNTWVRILNSTCSQSRSPGTPRRRPSLGSLCPGHETFPSLHRTTPSAARTNGFRTQMFHMYLQKNTAPCQHLRIVKHTTSNQFKRQISRAISSLRLANSPPLTWVPIVRLALPCNMHSTATLRSMVC